MALTLLDQPPVREAIADVEEIRDKWDGTLIRKATGLLTPIWQEWFQLFKRVVLAGGYVTQTTRADAPTTLTADDAGRVFYITDFFHWVRWNGTAYEFMGDPSGRFEDFAVAPGGGWALCDGSTVSYLVVGATLTQTNIVLPNLSGSPAYKKSGAAYAGTILAASGVSGATAPGTDSQGGHAHTVNSHNHSISASGDHTHGPGGTVGAASGAITAWDGASASALGGDHNHSGATGNASPGTDTQGAHTHTVNSHDHGPGTLDMPRLVVLPYFRR